MIITKNYEEMSQIAAAKIIEVIQKNPTGLYCFAGGDTPVRTLQLLVHAHQEKSIDLTKAHYIELDEWVGIDPQNAGSCTDYLNRNLFQPANIPSHQVHLFNPNADNLSNECQKADTYIEVHGGITLCLLGVGVNGHLGFNEPGVDFTLKSHITNLTSSTQNIGQKYFAQTEQHFTQGITLGISQLIAAEHLFIIASGQTKQKAIAQYQLGSLTNKWPITIANTHKNCCVIVDEATL